MRRADHQPKANEFALIMMLTAVVGAMAQVAGTVIELGRALEWWP